MELGGKLKRGAPKLDKGEESGGGKDETLVTRSVVPLGVVMIIGQRRPRQD